MQVRAIKCNIHNLTLSNVARKVDLRSPESSEIRIENNKQPSRGCFGARNPQGLVEIFKKYRFLGNFFSFALSGLFPCPRLLDHEDGVQ